MDESQSETDAQRSETSSRKLGAGAMTALSLAYPLVTAWYFWQDWGQYARREGPVFIGVPGVAVPVNEEIVTLLSPWRVIAALITAKLLFTSARKLRKGADDAKALSLLTLLGVVLPQTAWHLEFVNDWRGGEGFAGVAALGLAATALPALLLARGNGALAGWGKFGGANQKRVMGAAVGLGWLAMAAMALVDHSFQLRNAGATTLAALATMPLAALAMMGLFRQRTWALFAGGAAAAAAGVSMATLGDASLLETGGAMDTAFRTVASAPVLTAAIPAAVLALVLRPFVRGAARKLAGVDEATGVRVDATSASAPESEAEELAEEAASERASARAAQP